MAAIEFRGVRLGMEFSFPAVVGLLAVMGGAQSVLLLGLWCCTLHELGHLAAMLMVGARPRAVILYGGGVRILPGGGMSRNAELAVLLAGSGTNLACAALGALLHRWEMFSALSLMLGLFNLLPFRYFDGGRALTLALGRVPGWIRGLAAAGLLALTAVMGWRGSLSPSLLLTLGFILAQELGK